MGVVVGGANVVGVVVGMVLGVVNVVGGGVVVVVGVVKVVVVGDKVVVVGRDVFKAAQVGYTRAVIAGKPYERFFSISSCCFFVFILCRDADMLIYMNSNS